MKRHTLHCYLDQVAQDNLKETCRTKGITKSALIEAVCRKGNFDRSIIESARMIDDERRERTPEK